MTIYFSRGRKVGWRGFLVSTAALKYSCSTSTLFIETSWCGGVQVASPCFQNFKISKNRDVFSTKNCHAQKKRFVLLSGHCFSGDFKSLVSGVDVQQQQQQFVSVPWYSFTHSNTGRACAADRQTMSTARKPKDGDSQAICRPRSRLRRGGTQSVVQALFRR